MITTNKQTTFSGQDSTIRRLYNPSAEQQSTKPTCRAREPAERQKYTHRLSSARRHTHHPLRWLSRKQARRKTQTGVFLLGRTDPYYANISLDAAEKKKSRIGGGVIRSGTEHDPDSYAGWKGLAE